MPRGFAVIALDHPAKPENVGGALRAAQVYGASLVVLGAPQTGKKSINHCTNTMKAWRHIPTLVVDDVFQAIPHDTIPVAVDLLPGAELLPHFDHPERAFYIFGAENATLGKRIIDRCKYQVSVPTQGCMNLAATVNVVLYDRLAKRLIREAPRDYIALARRFEAALNPQPEEKSDA